ncbi:MAG: flavin reductase family protein [Sphingomonas fennica]
MRDYHFYEPAAGHGLPHDPFKAIVAPRPIGWISTMDGRGNANLAPYSFFNAVADNPPMIAFSSSLRKDSLTNAEETGVFGWNMATRALAGAMNATSAPLPHGEDEFAAAGLAKVPGRVTAVPLVADSPAALECRVTRIQRLADIDGVEIDQWLVIGQVVGVHIDRALLADGLFDTAAAGPILRAGYRDKYAAIDPDAMFAMNRPT